MIMKMPTSLKTLVLALSLTSISTNALAQLSADKTDLNSSTGSASVSVTFPTAISGDLYLAVAVGGQLLFFSDNGSKLSTVIAPFISNGSFSNAIHVLDVTSTGIPAGTYTLYQVVTKAGSSPLDLSNWIGGLSQLNFNINLSTPVAKSGATLYQELTCATDSCHGSNPRNNMNGILKGSRLSEIKNAIRTQPKDMGFLSTTSDADLQKVADYIKTFF